MLEIPKDSGYTFKFMADGSLFPIPDFFYEEFGEEPYSNDDFLHANGYYRQATRCLDNLFEIMIYRHHEDPYWIFEIDDAAQSCYIVIQGWATYFAALRYFAPILQLTEMEWATPVLPVAVKPGPSPVFKGTDD